MLLINDVYAASWIYTGQSASPTSRSDQEPNNHYCLTQSAPDAFVALVTSAELTPIRIILGHCTPVLLVCPSTRGEDPTETDLVTNYREWSMATQSGSGDSSSSTVCSEQNSLADTRGNGYVADELWMMLWPCRLGNSKGIQPVKNLILAIPKRWKTYERPGLAVWCSGNALISINAVALHRARLVLGWVTAFGQVNCLIT